MAEHIQAALKLFIEGLKTREKINLQRVVGGILDKKSREHIKFSHIDNNYLVFHADSSVWCHNFDLNKEGLLKKIKKEYPFIEGIKVKVKH